MILAGDIGGTKTVLAICDQDLSIKRQDVFPCAEYPSLEAILDRFLLPGDRAGLTAACFGVAGPVVDGSAKITNLTWTIDAARLSPRLGGIPVTLLNDLQATALGTLVLPDLTFAVLQPGAAPVQNGSIAVIAPGTGLGEALLVFDGAHYRALPSEGGHADFAPGNDEELALWQFLRARHGDHVSYERVLSGDGIGDLYDFVRRATGAAEPAWLTAEIAGHDRNATISKAALDGRDATCVHALDMFAEILGAEAGNLALRGLATGGVVIGGGIPPKILPVLQHERFVRRFNAKGRFAPWTRALRVRVALEPRAALFGAAHHAATYKDPRS
ncbi:MAG TPA: glucokinase [Kofleriaceae bacterium]|nr:glucokinase [Kofleriaceae bacterium]